MGREISCSLVKSGSPLFIAGVGWGQQMPVKLYESVGFYLLLTDPRVEQPALWWRYRERPSTPQTFHTWKNLKDLWIG